VSTAHTEGMLGAAPLTLMAVSRTVVRDVNGNSHCTRQMPPIPHQVIPAPAVIPLSAVEWVSHYFRFRFRYVLHPFAAKYSHWMWH
jgi:hypothetical protein